MGRVIDIAHENLQGETAESRSGNAFQCLDVWNLRQGELRLWLYSSVVGYLVIVSVYWQIWELLCLSVENMDTRDIVDDYRLSHAGVHSWHAQHWQTDRPDLELSVSVDQACGAAQARRPCTPNRITEHSDEDPDMIDPRFQAIYGSNLRLNFMQPSHTGYKYDITEYVYALDIASTAAMYDTVSIIIDVDGNSTDSDMMQPDCVGCHPASLPMYHFDYTERSNVGPHANSAYPRSPLPRLPRLQMCILSLNSCAVSDVRADRGAVSRESCGGGCVV
jgi:hypothetical protein